MDFFLPDSNTYTCGRSCPEICEYAYVILLDPVSTASIINKHGVQQACIFFVNSSDFWFDIMRSDKCSCDKFTQPIPSRCFWRFAPFCILSRPSAVVQLHYRSIYMHQHIFFLLFRRFRHFSGFDSKRFAIAMARIK